MYILRQSICYYIRLFKYFSFSLLTPLINLLTNYFKILINQSLGPLTLQRRTWIWKTPDVAPEGYFHGYNKTDLFIKTFNYYDLTRCVAIWTYYRYKLRKNSKLELQVTSGSSITHRAYTEQTAQN